MNRSEKAQGHGASRSGLRRSLLRRVAILLAVVLTTALAGLATASAAVLPGSHQLMNRQTAECLDVTGAKTGNGAEVRVWRCVNGPNQQWERVSATGQTALRVAHTGKCLTVQDDAGKGANIVQDICENRNDQMWGVVDGPEGWSTVRHGGLCLDKNWWGDATLWDCFDPKWQQWTSLG